MNSRRPRFVVAVAVVVAIATALGVVAPAVCYDTLWVERLRQAHRLMRWASTGAERAPPTDYLEQIRQTLRCGTFSYKDPDELLRELDQCMCWNLRMTTIDWVSQTFTDELDALPTSTSVDDFYLRNARPQLSAWRRAVALEGGQRLVKYFDELVDRCFTQPHSLGDKNEVPSEQARAPTSPPVTSRRTVQSPIATPAKDGESLLVALYNVLLGVVVGAFAVMLIQNWCLVRRCLRLWIQSLHGLPGGNESLSPSAVRNDEDLPPRPSDDVVQRSVDATE